MKAYVYSLTLVRWAIFGGLTFQGRVPSASAAWGLVRESIMRTAYVCHVKPRRLLWAVREERGDSTGRRHFHILIGDVGKLNLITLCHQLEYEWNQLTGAFAKFRVYDRRLSGVDYICKVMNLYEVGKYTNADHVTLSSSVYRVIGSQHMRERDAARIALDNKRAVESCSLPILQSSLEPCGALPNEASCR